jgi:hypothetical protein
MPPSANLFAVCAAADDAVIAAALHGAVAHGALATAADPFAERRCGSRPLMAASAELLLELALIAQALQRDLRAAWGWSGTPTVRDLRGEAAAAAGTHDAAGAAGLRDARAAESLALLRDTSAAAARLLWRALEAHPRGSYELGNGREGATRVARRVLRDARDGGPLPPRQPLAIARAAAAELFEALAASERDSVLVPMRLAAALGYVVALYLLATTLTESLPA